MTNIIRADIYRILRGKTLYLAFGILTAFLIFMISAGAINGVELPFVVSNTVEFNGMNSVFFLLPNVSILTFFAIPLITIVAGPVFQDKTSKNEVSWGMSRTKLYFSRLILVAALLLIMQVYFVGFGMLVSTLLTGFGGTPPAGYWLTVLQSMSSQYLLLVAAGAIGIFLFFVLKTSYAVVEFYFAAVMLPSMLVAFAGIAGLDLSHFLHFDIVTNIGNLGLITQFGSRNVAIALALGACLLTASTVAGLTVFRKAEIK